MEAYLHNFCFEILPYISVAVLVIGSILRMDRDPYSWRAKSSQFLRKKRMVLASNLFHVGILFLFVGHFVGLLTPKEVYHALGLTTEAKQLLAMISGGLAGTMCLVGLSMFMWRRLAIDRIRINSSMMDFVVLFMLLGQLLLGLMSIGASSQHMDGSSMVALANWAQYIVTFRPNAAEFLIGIHWIFKAHIVLGLMIFIITPFSRLVHMFSAPLGYLFRTGYQIVRRRANQ